MHATNLAAPIKAIYTTYKTTRTQALHRAEPLFEISKGRYTATTVTRKKEYLEVLKLRYEVFHREYRGRMFPFGFDVDIYDSNADYLIVRDNKQRRVIGAYRIISSKKTEVFYSASEYHIDSFLCQPGDKAELSRACVHRHHRNGIVLTLLWRALVEYMNLTQTRWLFGIPSLKTVDPNDAAAVYVHLQNIGAWKEGWQIKPTDDFAIAGFQGYVEQWKNRESAAVKAIADGLIPPLLKTYIKAGARIIAEPVLDREFQCIDYFTVLDMAHLDQRYRRKYSN